MVIRIVIIMKSKINYSREMFFSMFLLVESNPGESTPYSIMSITVFSSPISSGKNLHI